MPQYVPPPASLDSLNPIQRYMQKGELDREDWVRLGVLVLVYFVARPYISEAFKWFFTDTDAREGEAAQKAYAEKRAKIGPNAIRGGKTETDEADPTTESGATTSGISVGIDQTTVNRKSKPSKVSGSRSTEEKVVDWEDEDAEPPVLSGTGVEKADVMTWLDKWDQ